MPHSLRPHLQDLAQRARATARRLLRLPSPAALAVAAPVAPEAPLRPRWDGDDWRTVLNAVPDAVLGVDVMGRIRSASPAVDGLFGLPPAQLIGRPLHELLPELDATGLETRALHGRHLDESRLHVARFETEARRRSGSRFAAEVSLARLDNSEGPSLDPTAQRYACLVRDVAEQRLVASLLNLYLRALQATGSGVLIVDMGAEHQPIIFANAAFTRLTGYEPGHAIGRHWRFLQREDRHQPEQRQLAAALAQGRSCTVVLRCYRADGSLFFGELAVSPVPTCDGPPQHCVAILNDVTARERARSAIAERYARLNAVFDLSPDGFAVFDREHQLVYVNRAFLLMTGWDGAVATEGLSLREFEWRLLAQADPAAPYPRLAPPADRPPRFDTLDLLRLTSPRPRMLSRLVRHDAGGLGDTILYFRDLTPDGEMDRIQSEFLAATAKHLLMPGAPMPLRGEAPRPNRP